MFASVILMALLLLFCSNLSSRPRFFCLYVYNKLQKDNYKMAMFSYLKFLPIHVSDAHRKASLLIKIPFVLKDQMECREQD